MADQKLTQVNFHKTVLDISKKLNEAGDFDSALAIAADELKKALEVERIQIIMHRSEQD